MSEVGAADDIWTVENASPASKPATFAAEEMRRYLEATSGTEARIGTAASDQPRVVVGLRRDLDPDDARHLPEPATGYDGYAVAIRNHAEARPVWIVGGDNERGTLYGVYDVLERLGWRWFHPALDPNDPEVRPLSKQLRLEDDRWSLASPMRIRTLIWYVDRKRVRNHPPPTEHLRAQIDWLFKARHNTLEHSAIEFEATHPLRKTLIEEAERRGLRLQSFGHSFAFFLPNSPDTFAKHPEWFGESMGKRRSHSYLGSQFCWTHEGAVHEFTQNVRAFLAERPEVDTLVLSPVDGGNAKPCSCETCSSRTPTDRYLSLVNHVAETIETEFPDVEISTLVGYQHLADRPEAVDVHPRVRARFAVWRRGLARGYSTDRRGPDLAAWSDVFDRRLTAVQYYSDNYANPALASVYTTQMKSDRDFILQQGTDGYLNLLYRHSYWWRLSLNAYVAGRGFYDPSLEFSEILDDYARRYHGPQAGPLMADYYAALAAAPTIGALGWRMPRQREDSLLPDLQREKLRPAAELVRNDRIFRHRIRKVQLWHIVALYGALASKDVQQAGEVARLDADEAEKLLARARKTFESAITRAEEIASGSTGVLGASYVVDYRERFAAMVGKVERTAARTRMLATLGPPSPPRG